MCEDKNRKPPDDVRNKELLKILYTKRMKQTSERIYERQKEWTLS